MANRELAIKWLEAEIIKARDTSNHLQSRIAELNSDLGDAELELMALKESHDALARKG